MPQFNDPTTELSYLEKDDVLLSGSPSEYANIKAQNLFNRSLTRSALQTLIQTNKLLKGQHYTITDAVGSTLSLQIIAVDVDTLSEIAVNTENGESYKYDITTDVAVLEPNPIALGTANQILGVNNGATAQEYKTLSGTAKQIIVTDSEGEITLSNALGDTVIDTPTNGQGLFYNSTTEQWENKGVRGIISKQGLNVFPHRGVTAWGAPENSLISLYHSYLAGADIVEFDVEFTSDGVLVLLHDDTLNSQFTNSDGSPIVGTVNINDITYSQSLNYIRSSTTDGYKTQITLLDDFLRDCAKYNIRPLVELNATFPESLDDDFIAITRKYFRDEEILLESFDDDLLVRFAAKTNYYPVFVSGNYTLASEYRGAIFVNYTTINQTLVDNCIAVQVPILAYTIDSQSEFNRLIDLGVTLMTSNYLAPENIKSQTYIDNYDSDLSFANATVSNGSISSGESLVTLNNTGYVQTPAISCSTLGIIQADVIVNGTCTIELYIGGVLYDTITNTATVANTLKISRLINLDNTFYIKVTATQSNCKVISIKCNSVTVPQTVENRTFVKPIRSDAGIGIGFDATSGKEVLNGGASTPSLSTWDSGGFGKRFGFQQDTYFDSILGVASDTAIYKSSYVAKKSRGSLASPSALSNGDAIGGFLASAYDGTLFRNFASIDFFVDGVVSSGTAPIGMSFNTGTTSRTEKARITSSGVFLIGATSAVGVNSEKFEVTGSALITGVLSIGGVTTGTYPTNGKLVIGGGANGSSASVIQNRMDISFSNSGNSTVFMGIINPDFSTMIGVLGTRDGGSNKATIYMRNQQVGIGNSVPATSAILDVSSTTKGVLLPRMTTTEKNAISSPATGLVVYDTTLNKLCVYTGAAWQTVTSA